MALEIILIGAGWLGLGLLTWSLMDVAALVIEKRVKARARN